MFFTLFVTSVVVINFAPALFQEIFATERQELRNGRSILHEGLSAAWVAMWTMNVAWWWGMIYTGSFQRYDDDDWAKACAAAALWASVCICQHVLLIPVRHRAVVIMLGTSIALTGLFPRLLTSAIAFGEIIGYGFQYVMRFYLLRMEQLRQEKDHVAFELAMSQKRAAKSSRKANLGAGNLGAGSPAADDPPVPASSYGTNSEVGRVTAAAGSVRGRPRGDPSAVAAARPRESAQKGTRRAATPPSVDEQIIAPEPRRAARSPAPAARARSVHSASPSASARRGERTRTLSSSPSSQSHPSAVVSKRLSAANAVMLRSS